MKKGEKENLKTEISSNVLIAGQGLWECVRKLEYKVEHSECLDNTETKELLRSLSMVEERFKKLNKAIDSLIFK